MTKTNLILPVQNKQEKSIYETELLHIAIAKKDIRTIKYCLDVLKIGINAESINGDTPLITAVYSDEVEIVEFLCKYNGIDINTKGEYQDTALGIADILGLQEIKCFLLDHPNYDKNNSPEKYDKECSGKGSSNTRFNAIFG